jgi:TPR repeat protein
MALLLKRGEDLIAQGDIAAARLMLTRAAEAGEARAALTLGATYDPEMLRRLGVRGVAADAALARAWYEKAAEYGSGEATRRLEQVAQSVR